MCFNTISIILGADFNTVLLWQLMLLPGTPMASPGFVEKWGMKTKYRVIPRCFAYYDFKEERVISAEIERIVVASNTLSYDDYLDCRRMHFNVNLFYNDCVFKDVMKLLNLLKIPKNEWMEHIHQYTASSGFNALMNKFIKETQEELWDSEEELIDFVKNVDNIKLFMSGELGYNLIYFNRAYAMVYHVSDLAEVATATIDALLIDKGFDENVRGLARDLVKFCRFKMMNMLQNINEVPSADFSYDVMSFSENNDVASLNNYQRRSSECISFVLTPEQIRTVETSLKIYGNSLSAHARIISVGFTARLFRTPVSTFGKVTAFS